MKTKFTDFIKRLENDDNHSLIEAVEHGFNTIFEGYADVREVEAEDAITMFTRQAANVALNQGNPVLQFLQNSAEKTSHMYTFDDETELDSRDTIDYRDYIVNTPSKTSYANSLGLTASEISSGDNSMESDLGLDFELDF